MIHGSPHSNTLSKKLPDAICRTAPAAQHGVKAGLADKRDLAFPVQAQAPSEASKTFGRDSRWRSSHAHPRDQPAAADVGGQGPPLDEEARGQMSCRSTGAGPARASSCANAARLLVVGGERCAGCPSSALDFWRNSATRTPSRQRISFEQFLGPIFQRTFGSSSLTLTLSKNASTAETQRGERIHCCDKVFTLDVKVSHQQTVLWMVFQKVLFPTDE